MGRETDACECFCRESSDRRDIENACMLSVVVR